MKKAIFLLIMLFSISSIYAQNEKTKSDTTKLKFGNKTIIIIEKKIKDEEVQEEKEIKVEEGEDIVKEEEEKVAKKKKYNSRNFSRWAGINLGFNQFVYLSDMSALSGKSENWSINPWKSTTWNINIMEFNVSLIKKHLLLTTGLGFQFRKYSFDKNIILVYDDKKNISAVVDKYIDYDKDKLSASYVQLPLLLEINTSSRPKKGFYLATGVIGGYKMTSKLKQVNKFDGRKIKVKIYDDFQLNPYQLEGTIRIGINRFTLFANFDMLPVFREDKIANSEDLSNITLGIQLIGF
jgi:hypothetical protein